MNVKKQEMLWNKTHKKGNCIEIEKNSNKQFSLNECFLAFVAVAATNIESKVKLPFN